jgi:hypothetical protein
LNSLWIRSLLVTKTLHTHTPLIAVLSAFVFASGVVLGSLSLPYLRLIGLVPVLGWWDVLTSGAGGASPNPIIGVFGGLFLVILFLSAQMARLAYTRSRFKSARQRPLPSFDLSDQWRLKRRVQNCRIAAQNAFTYVFGDFSRDHAGVER